MDYGKIKEKLNYILEALKCMDDPETNEEFLLLLDVFTMKAINKCQSEIMKDKIRNN
jgi:hypothetical protein